MAKIFGGQKIKVNAELNRLAEAGIVTRRKAASGKLGWTLEDPDLRSLLRKRIRICFAPDWDRGRPGSGEAVDLLLSEIEASLPDPKVNLEFYRPRNWKRALLSGQHFERKCEAQRRMRSFESTAPALPIEREGSCEVSCGSGRHPWC